jgi:phosphotriesterase-related protein
MSSIMTVLGPVDPSEVGFTSSHEHIFACSTSNRFDQDTRLDEMETAVEELLEFKQAGGDAIVDVTTIDMGRDANRLVELSAVTGVRIIAATGFYKGNYSSSGEGSQRSWEYLPAELHQASIPQLSEVFITEIREGIAGTKVKAGIIGEIGTSFNQIEEPEANVLRAAARAHRVTGAPISTHTTLGTMGREQLSIFKEEGVDLQHVVLCHMDLRADTSYHFELARQGAFLGFDTAGKQQYQSDATRVELIRRLVQEGFEDQIIISCDIGRRSQMQRHGGRGYVYLLRKFVPALRVAGIQPGVIDKFLVHNPRRLLAF